MNYLNQLDSPATFDETREDCPICKSSLSSSNEETRSGLTFRKCPICRVLFLDPPPSMDYLSLFYRKDYWSITNSNRSRRYSISKQLRRAVLYQQMLSEVRPALNPSKILEIGSGLGGVVFGLGKVFDADAYCIEPDERAREFSAKLGVQAVRDFPSGDKDTFDLVVLSHVLEHHPNPQELLLSAISYLRQGGALIVEVPQGDWVFDGGIEHPVVFGKRSLRALLQSHGLKARIKSHKGQVTVLFPPRYLTAIAEIDHTVAPLTSEKLSWRWPNSIIPRILRLFTGHGVLQSLDKKLAKMTYSGSDKRVEALLNEINPSLLSPDSDYGDGLL